MRCLFLVRLWRHIRAEFNKKLFNLDIIKGVSNLGHSFFILGLPENSRKVIDFYAKNT